jgi:hypothetical protein
MIPREKSTWLLATVRGRMKKLTSARTPTRRETGTLSGFDELEEGDQHLRRRSLTHI